MLSKSFFIVAIIVIATVSSYTQSFSKKFDFGIGRTAEVYNSVSTINTYSKETGYGFEDVTGITCFSRNDKNLLLSGFCSSDKPFYFSVNVPEGNYKVNVTFGDFYDSTDTTVKAELRRLMLEDVKTNKGKFATKTFIVNVRRPEISMGGTVKLKDREKTMEWWAWDEKLTLEFNGKKPNVNAIEIEKIDSVPTVFLLGDSTVCDQPREPYASWGQMLTRFFQPTIAVASHAESGESLKSSFGAKRLEKVLSLLKSGDYVLIQYAHNDEKEKGDGIGAFTTFKASLKQYVEAIRKKGGIPILITPMHRRTFDADGKITNSHGDYPEAVRQAAKELNAPLIDLTAMSKDFYEALGKEKSGLAFKDGDGTHHNNYGAYELAKMIVSSIQTQKLPLAKFLVKDLKKFDPKKPDALESFNLPASPMVTDVKPLGN
ncbi:MAG TPA: rhamnogalacturonan acetylesterase [Pyrinomonadaceae bacterium]|nr:rhamnogalacturonan acetylesterase [Pyrinomonadaceae bacterium]